MMRMGCSTLKRDQCDHQHMLLRCSQKFHMHSDDNIVLPPPTHTAALRSGRGSDWDHTS